jgi:hypothetical protein
MFRMNNEQIYEDYGNADAFGKAMSPAELQAAIAADLNELRAVGMRFIRRMDAKADTPEGDAMLPQLNNAVVKVARAVRQIAVLQLEVAGLRQQPNARAPAAAPANENTEFEETGNGNRPCLRPWDRGDYNDYDDYSDSERRIVLDALIDSKRKIVVAAMDEDFRSAGRDDIFGSGSDHETQDDPGDPASQSRRLHKDDRARVHLYVLRRGRHSAAPARARAARYLGKMGRGPEAVWAG